MSQATAIVVARANSVRLPGKALLAFAGTTLIGHKVRTLLQTKSIGRVVVGSDSDDILDEARSHGAEIVKRDDYHCDERRCSANEMIHDMVSRVPGEGYEWFIWAHPTNPLVKAETYDRAIAEFHRARFGPCENDSLVSVRRESRHAWFQGKPLNHPGSAGKHQVASRLEPVYFQDGAIFIQSRENWLKNAAFYGRNPARFEIEGLEGWDVDTAADFAIALALYASVSPSGLRGLQDSIGGIDATNGVGNDHALNQRVAQV